MAIVETILGPNSSKFKISATDTTAQIMAALNDYIVAHGWELFDDAAPQGLAGTTPVGRVYRALQDGSTTVYKYVGIAMNTITLQLRVYESWNATTHVGTNDGSFVSTGGSSVPSQAATQLSIQTGIDNPAFILFVNKKWLAIRQQYQNLTYSYMIGAFEIKKDFGEDPAFPSVIFMSNMTSPSYPGNSYHAIYGSPRSLTAPNATGATAAYYNEISTVMGVPNSSVPFSSFMPSNFVPNITATMTAVEMQSGGAAAINKFRGRIFGIKLVGGGVIWNDMDQVQIAVDDEFIQNASGSVMAHHVINNNTNVNQSQVLRFVLPL